MHIEKIFTVFYLCKIFSQIENEYGPMEYEVGAPGRAYTQWAAHMAVGLGTGVPWIMCKQDDAPDPIVSSAYLYLLYTFSLIIIACYIWWGY